MVATIVYVLDYTNGCYYRVCIRLYYCTIDIPLVIVLNLI